MPLPDLNTPNEVRAFLRLCLKPPARSPRTPSELSRIMPEWLSGPLHEHAPHLAELRAEVARLDRAAADAHGALATALARWIDGIEPEPSAPVDEEQEPVQLRWGLDDVMYGDDDTTTVMLSDEQRRPYWLELEPERTTALRTALAGPTEDATALPSIGFLDVEGTCPACGHPVLMLGENGHVVCTLANCPDPDAADRLLATVRCDPIT
ncbi:hypothetical protein ACUXZZ_45295 (plasmid) [Streptomyces graminifolii]|uniref:hypothetical protein n=1 Tax=Streptomyces graminifolii TaxID=1266771 RepID=UPI004058C6A9